MISENKNNRGIALFIVLWILVLLSVIAGEFCNAMRTGIFMTRNFKEETQAYYIAKAGLNIGISELMKNDPVFQKKAETDIKDQDEEIQWRVNAPIPFVDFGEGAFQVKISNESGKININRADRNLMILLLNKFELDDKDKNTIIDSILDWRDKDDLHRLNGAENAYYQSLAQPYNAKNNDFDSIEELLLVKGISPEIFKGMRSMVTVYPKTDIENKPGQKQDEEKFDYNKININAVSSDVLSAFPLITEEHIQAINEFRQEKDFRSVSQLFPIIDQDVYNSISPYLSVQLSPVFTISSSGTIINSKTTRAVKAVIEIDDRHNNKYHIIQWTDRLEY
ncbi:Type II secretion system protein, protein K [Desulfonema limicola]|uniref:Type II secretion system protein, protein K n=1 Tax=Desulfonema limicola TaxID=45656 RepID=A0A975B880_9BACT|nr:type II secretion system protein GspK [Desulfonema limicola]QTA80617.1 Type II secretion system protein, protein K [Desulfonema limicola]